MATLTDAERRAQETLAASIRQYLQDNPAAGESEALATLKGWTGQGGNLSPAAYVLISVHFKRLLRGIVRAELAARKQAVKARVVSPLHLS
jgi:hypothetical protein